MHTLSQPEQLPVGHTNISCVRGSTPAACSPESQSLTYSANDLTLLYVS